MLRLLLVVESIVIGVLSRMRYSHWKWLVVGISAGIQRTPVMVPIDGSVVDANNVVCLVKICVRGWVFGCFDHSFRLNYFSTNGLNEIRTPIMRGRKRF